MSPASLPQSTRALVAGAVACPCRPHRGKVATAGTSHAAAAVAVAVAALSTSSCPCCFGVGIHTGRIEEVDTRGGGASSTEATDTNERKEGGRRPTAAVVSRDSGKKSNFVVIDSQ